VYFAKSDFQEIAIYDTYGFGKCLFLNGVIQSAEKDHLDFDQVIISQLRPIDREILILGGGDGHTAEIALKNNPKLNITVVDRDISVIEACKKYLGQNIYENTRVNVVIGDAIDFLNDNKCKKYDGVICDLTDIPLGFDNTTVFYSIIYSKSIKILNDSGWFTAYIGCDRKVVEDIVQCNNGLKNNCSISIESFGEPCFFIHDEGRGR
jgi:spermidine synthase